MTGRRFALDIPACPSCGELVGLRGTFRARLDRYECPRCGQALKIPRKPQLLHVLLLYLALVTISKNVPGIRGYVIVGAVIIVGGILEYMTVRLAPSQRSTDHQLK